MKIIKNSHHLSIFIGLILCLIFSSAKVFNVSFFSIVAFVLSIVLVLLMKTKTAILVFFFAIPNTGYFSINGSAVAGYMAIAIVLKFFLTGNKLYLKTVFPVILTALMVFLASLTNGWYQNILSYVKVVFYFLLMVEVGKKYQNDIHLFATNYVLGAFVCSLLGLFYNALGGLNIFIIGRYSRFESLVGDPNYFSAFVAFAIALVVYLVFTKRMKLVFAFPLFAVLVFSGLASLSRGFVLAFALIALLGGTLFIFSKKISFSTKIIIAILVILVAVQIVKNTNLTDMILFRFQDASISDGNGRIEIWSWYFSRSIGSFRRFAFGSGSAHVAVSNGAYRYIEHNTYLQVFYEIGLIGFFLYFFSFYYFAKQCKIGKFGLNNKVLILIPLLAATVPYIFLSQMYGENFIVSLLLAVLLCNKPISKEKLFKERFINT